MQNTKIKICGLTRKVDIEYVNELMPDYIGFVFAKSRRRVSKEQAKELIELLDKRIKTVGVFVNEDIQTVKELQKDLSLDILQFHGNENKEYVDSFSGCEIWKAVSIKSNQNSYEAVNSVQLLLDNFENSNVGGFLFDTAGGGTGMAFNWDIIKNLSINKKIILAGGLRCDNVADGIEHIRPNVVDVSSGVELEGYKDFAKIKELVDRVRMIV